MMYTVPDLKQDLGYHPPIQNRSVLLMHTGRIDGLGLFREGGWVHLASRSLQSIGGSAYRKNTRIRCID